MMKIASILMAAAMLAVSCNKFDETDSAGPGTPASEGLPITIAGGFGTPSRAEWDKDDEFYCWQNTAEQVGLSIVNAAGTAAFSQHNIQMSMSTLTPDRVNALFTGTGGAQEALGMYNYYSYFPYNGASGTGFPTVQFNIPSVMTLTPNKLSSQYAPMSGRVTDAQPIWANGVSDPIRFNYNHVMSYAAFVMDVNMIPGVPITSLTISASGTTLAGTLNVDISAGTANWAAGGSNSITVTIPNGGLTAGNDDQMVFIPILPGDLSGVDFTITPNPGSTDAIRYLPTTIKGANFQRGKIHELLYNPAIQIATTGLTTFTASKAGYYHIEAWGGNGGAGQWRLSPNGVGGVSLRISGLYQFSAGQTISLCVGTAGGTTGDTGDGQGGAGGTNGSGAFGIGGTGGRGGYGGTTQSSGRGGGGGAGTFIFSGTNTSTADFGNILLVSGGGGGGGGGQGGASYVTGTVAAGFSADYSAWRPGVDGFVVISYFGGRE